MRQSRIFMYVMVLALSSSISSGLAEKVETSKKTCQRRKESILKGDKPNDLFYKKCNGGGGGKDGTNDDPKK